MGRDARPPSAERVNRTKRLIRDAESAHQLSSSIREQSTVLKKVVEKDTERHQATVNELLQQKVAETEALARKLETRIGACDAEMASLGEARRQAQALLESRRVPLGIAEKRLRVRDDLPDREKLNDNVDRALRQEIRDLQMACDKLSGVIHNADDTMANLERNRAALAADYQDKRAALELDQNCLGVTITTAPGGFSPQKGARPALSAVLPQAVTQKSATLPEIWRKSTHQLLQMCQDAEKQSANLRTVIAKTIQQLSQANTTALKSTQTALKGKVRETGSLRSALDRRLQSVNDEIAALETERLHLTETLATKEGPLETVKQRLAIRKQRPAREAVRDAVEEALEAELARLRNSVDSLNRKLDSVDRELRRLNEVKAQIEADLQDKTHALQLDRQCLDLDVADLPSPRRSYAGSVAMSATGSVPSTPRLPATPSRRMPLTAR